MARRLRIRIDTSRYQTPTDEDVRKAKKYVLDADDTYKQAWSIAGDIIMDYVLRIVDISYKYNIPPERFAFDSSVNSMLMEEVSAVMEELDEELFSVLQQEALSCTTDSRNRTYLLAILLMLGHRGMNMSDTLYSYEWRLLRQVEGIIASAKFNGKSASETKQNIRNYLGMIERNPLINSTLPYRSRFSAQFINNGGKATYPNGAPNVSGVPVDGYNAIRQVFGNAIATIWRKNQLLEMQQDGCAGYYQLRGSNIPCAICDDEVGFHEGCDPDNDAYPHPNCLCYRIPVYFLSPSTTPN